MFVTSSLLYDALGLTVALFAIIYTYFKWSFTYWSSRNVPCQRANFPLGNMKNPMKSVKPFTLEFADYYAEMKSRGHRHCGMFLFQSPVYVPIDIELVKNVMAKDFAHFVNHGVYFNEKADPLSVNLFAIEDEKWRNLRAKLTPTFTSGKLKAMFQTLVDCGTPFRKQIDRLHSNGEPLDIKEMVARYTTDIIGSCAFGLDCNSFEGEGSEFRKYGRMFFDLDLERQLKGLFQLVFPEWATKFNMITVPEVISDFFIDVVKKTVNYREKTNFTRKDFMQLLIELKNKEGAINMNELAAQAFVFFLAGFETSSTTMTYALFELALNQNIQDKVRTEIKEVLAKHNGEITYDAVMEMKYMQQVLDETLRKYPPLPLLNRVCNLDYKVPDSDVVIEKGTKVFISAYGIHHDEEFYPDPEKFDPERFSPENKSNRNQYTYLPFGEGPRICIGLRFGLMQSKVGLITVLENNRISLNGKTPEKLNMDIKSFILANAETIYLDTEKI